MSKAVDMSRHFTVPDLLKFTLPTMGMMLFASIYGIVDGLFISNFAGKTAFAAVNMILPFVLVLESVGFMMGTGGGALVGHARGEGDEPRANRWFSLITWFSLILGIVLGVVGFILMPQAAQFLGADAAMMEDSILYGRISMVSVPFFILQTFFSPIVSTAGKPGLGLKVSIAAGITNMALDFLLVGLLDMGVTGAATATVASEIVGGGIPLVYFLCPNNSHLRLGRCSLEWKVLGKACANGSSEMVASIAMSVAAMVYNWQLMRIAGEAGVGAYGVIMYVGFAFGALLIGFSMGVDPLISFQHGAGNDVEKRSLFVNSLKIVGVGGLVMFAAAELLSGGVAFIYAGYDPQFQDMVLRGFRIYMVSFLFCGFSIYASGLFTALGNGVVSAVISFARTFIFEIGSVLLLPMVFGLDGVWLAIIVAELVSLALAAACVLKFGRGYGILK